MVSFRNLLGETPKARREALWGIGLVAPNVLGLLFFFGIPVLTAFATSVTKWNLLTPAEFIGTANFERLFADPTFWQAVGNSFKLLLLVVPAGVVLALGAAMLLNQRLRGRSIFRVIFFLPVVTSTVAASAVWTWVFQPRYGLLGNLLEPFGLRDQSWLTSPTLVLIPIAVVTIWQRLGFDLVLFLAGLQTIPRVLHEAAVIDGANRWQRFRYVTFPMLSPTTFLVVMLSIINALQIFDQVYIMTARVSPGGVNGSATTLTYFLYDHAFRKFEFGYSSAVALVLFLIILGLTVFQLRLQRRWVYYESEAG